MKHESIQYRMRTLPVWFGVALTALLAHCATGNRDELEAADGSRLDILTDFTLTLSKRDFRSALNDLSQEDRARMADAQGGVLPEFRERLLALRLTTLLHDPEIRIVHGKIQGIYAVLPSWGTGEQAAAPDSEMGDTNRTVLTENTSKEPAPDSALEQAAHRFFKSVERKQWRKALDMVDVQERGVFVKGDGKLRPGTRRRLAAVDTASWQALSYQGGKLAGVVLLIPDKAAGMAPSAN